MNKGMVFLDKGKEKLSFARFTSIVFEKATGDFGVLGVRRHVFLATLKESGRLMSVGVAQRKTRLTTAVATLLGRMARTL